MNDDVLSKLGRRLGPLHAKQRLGIETDHEAQVFGQGLNFFHIENWYSIHSVIRNTLKLTGLYWRGRRNTTRIQVRHNDVYCKTLPSHFDGFTVLHLSDLHVDMNEGAMLRLTNLLPNLNYDLCVLTGDYRGRTFGPFDATLEGLERVRSHLKGAIYGVLGNHDTIRMVPALEEMGIRMLLNECEMISRDGQSICLAGIDDAHYYRVDNIEGCVRNPPRRVRDPAVAHAGDLSSGRPCRFRSALERPYAWRADMLARFDSDYARFSFAEAHGVRCLEISRYDWLHIGRRRVVRRQRSDQLSSGDNAASPAARLIAVLSQ
jgi:hypothetical protein